MRPPEEQGPLFVSIKSESALVPNESMGEVLSKCAIVANLSKLVPKNLPLLYTRHTYM